MPGIQPLSSSPVPPANSAPVVSWGQTKGAVDECGPTSLDKACNSRDLLLMKTPRLVPRGASGQETNRCNGKGVVQSLISDSVQFRRVSELSESFSFCAQKSHIVSKEI
jgi:hypothetical protein